MLFNYQEFLDGIDRAAYHEGEWQWEEDGYTVTRTYTYSAPGLPRLAAACSCTSKDGKLEKIEGDPLDPCANGRLCMRCLNLVEGVNYEDRPKYPLRRAGERGENKWERITWDEALDQICRLDPREPGRGGLRPRVHLREPRHRPQHLVLGAVSGRRLPGHAQHRRHRLLRVLVLPAAHVRHGGRASATSPSWTPRKGMQTRYANPRMASAPTSSWCGAASR